MIQIDQIDKVRKFRLARAILGRGYYFTSCYWVDGLMIDTGCSHTVGELVSSLEGLGLHSIVNTHSHEDHIGANAILHEKYGADILAHPLALPFLADPRKRVLHLYQRVMWGYPTPSSGSAVGNLIETENFRFEVIHTPGHSEDHICLYERDEGWLFTGDAFIGGRDHALRDDYDIWRIIASLKKIAGLKTALLFPGSGNLRKSPTVEIKKKIEYLEELGDRVLALHSKGRGYRGIYRELFGREKLLTYITLGHFSGKKLIRSYIMDQP